MKKITKEELDRTEKVLTGDWVSCRKMPFSKLVMEALDNGWETGAYVEFVLLMQGERSTEAFGIHMFDIIKQHIEIEVDLEIKEILGDE